MQTEEVELEAPRKPVGGAFQEYVAHWRSCEGYAAEVDKLDARGTGRLAKNKFDQLTAEEKQPFQDSYNAALSTWRAWRAAQDRPEVARAGPKKERFVRSDKARAMTAAEARGWVSLDDD